MLLLPRPGTRLTSEGETEINERMRIRRTENAKGKATRDFERRNERKTDNWEAKMLTPLLLPVQLHKKPDNETKS